MSNLCNVQNYKQNVLKFFYESLKLKVEYCEQFPTADAMFNKKYTIFSCIYSIIKIFEYVDIYYVETVQDVLHRA